MLIWLLKRTTGYLRWMLGMKQKRDGNLLDLKSKLLAQTIGCGN